MERFKILFFVILLLNNEMFPYKVTRCIVLPSPVHSVCVVSATGGPGTQVEKMNAIIRNNRNLKY